METKRHHVENNKQFPGLNVNSGIKQPPMLNPYAKMRKARPEYSVEDYVKEILKGNRTVLSQAVTLIESNKPEHQEKAQQIIEKGLPYAGKSIRVGITGVPGRQKDIYDSFGCYI